MKTSQPHIHGQGEPPTGDLAGGAHIPAIRIIALSTVSVGVHRIYRAPNLFRLAAFVGVSFRSVSLSRTF